jgi:hypothetical protein
MVYVKREQSDENREVLLATASRLFRERGIDGVGVAEIGREECAVRQRVSGEGERIRGRNGRRYSRG